MLNRHLTALCVEGVSAYAQLGRLADQLIDASSFSALLLPLLSDSEERAALRRAEFQIEAAKAVTTAASIVSAALAGASVVARSTARRGPAIPQGALRPFRGLDDFDGRVSPLSERNVSSALTRPEFCTLVTTVSALDATTTIGRRSILEAAFGSGCAIVIWKYGQFLCWRACLTNTA